MPKIPVIDYMTFANEEAWKQNPNRWELHIHWRKGIQFSIINNDYLGPTTTEVIQMYADIFGNDE